SSLAVAAWFSGDVGAVFAQGSAYGAEQRFPLKAPVSYQLPMALTWVVTAGLALTGATLLANEVWIVGVAVLGALGQEGRDVVEEFLIGRVGELLG
ncbi:MAG TPA: hypothetical protein PLV68_10335, partial [Ilumatobacteraceae bacterium]|nr:hypothetical protein [Ilumatobacteraceae bacterium]